MQKENRMYYSRFNTVKSGLKYGKIKLKKKYKKVLKNYQKPKI